MKKLIIIISMFFASNVSACIQKNILIIGQSNAVYMSQLDLATIFGDTNCPAKIFKSVRSGTGIEAFTPSWSTSSLYGRTSAAIEDAGVQLDVIVFWQGENDAKTAKSATSWASIATQTIQSYRVEYGKSKSIPVIIFALNDKHKLQELGTPYWLYIRNRQFSMARKNIILVDSSKYEFNADLVHLTLLGYQKAANDVSIILRSLQP